MLSDGAWSRTGGRCSGPSLAGRCLGRGWQLLALRGALSQVEPWWSATCMWAPWKERADHPTSRFSAPRWANVLVRPGPRASCRWDLGCVRSPFHMHPVPWVSAASRHMHLSLGRGLSISVNCVPRGLHVGALGPPAGSEGSCLNAAAPGCARACLRSPSGGVGPGWQYSVWLFMLV